MLEFVQRLCLKKQEREKQRKSTTHNTHQAIKPREGHERLSLYLLASFLPSPFLAYS